ncbi:hypothetical protein FRC10_007903 [Ceratobasidium sp. 414]|nr:hypothetical protein FRC10_007903 [Ceratobasidium sp. 414]
MYRLSTVLMLLVTVTSLLSLVSVVSVCPIAADVVCSIDCISDLVVLPRAICVCVRHVLPALNVCRLTRAFDALSALAGEYRLPYAADYCQNIRLPLPIAHYLALDWPLPPLHDIPRLAPGGESRRVLWIVFGEVDELYQTKVELTVIFPVGCVYVVLCGAPILVLYCVVLDANPSLKPKQEPVLGIPYAVVRRRKLPRMLQERYEREREQALEREAKRQQARFATLRSPNPPPTDFCEPPPTESSLHQPAKQADTESAGSTPLVPTRETKVEPCDIIVLPSPFSSISPATPNTKDYENSSPTEGAALPLAEGPQVEFKTWDTALSTSGNLDTPPVVQHEAIAANDAPIVGSCLVSSPATTTGSEPNKLSQAGTENSVVKRVDLLDSSDTIVKDILATPGVAALIEAAVAELGSALANDIANPPLAETNWIATNEDADSIESMASTAGSHTTKDDSDWDARLLENDSAGRSDPTAATHLAQDASALSSTDVHMTTEQVDAVLELLDAELARTDADLAGLGLELGLGPSESADITLASPPITPATIPTADADLQALDAMWESMGIHSAEPGHMDIDLGAVGLDSTTSTGETCDGGTGMDLKHNVYAPGELVAVLPGLNVAGPVQDIEVQMMDEECLAVLAQLCEEAIGAIVGDMDLDETGATFTTAPSEQQAMAQQPNPATRSSTYGSSEATRCDVSMSDEDCMAQLAELCKYTTPATNPEADLEQTLAMLSRLVGGTAGGAVAQDVAGPTYDLAPPRTGGAPESAGPCGCMRLEDVINWAMVVDDAGEVDTSESEDGSEYLATPIVGPMEVLGDVRTGDYFSSGYA